MHGYIESQLRHSIYTVCYVYQQDIYFQEGHLAARLVLFYPLLGNGLIWPKISRSNAVYNNSATTPKNFLTSFEW